MARVLAVASRIDMHQLGLHCISSTAPQKKRIEDEKAFLVASMASSQILICPCKSDPCSLDGQHKIACCYLDACKPFFTSRGRDSTHDPIGYVSKFEDRVIAAVLSQFNIIVLTTDLS